MFLFTYIAYVPYYLYVPRWLVKYKEFAWFSDMASAITDNV